MQNYAKIQNHEINLVKEKKKQYKNLVFSTKSIYKI